MEDGGKDKEVHSSSEESEEPEEEEGKKKRKNKGGKKKGGGGSRKQRNDDSRAESILTPEEIGRMLNLGLGRGVDATNPSPWLNKSAFQVREVTPHNIMGTEEGGVLRSYCHEVESIQTMQTSMSASVPVSQQVSVGVDAELSRSYSSNRRSVGKKIITRSICYKADFDDLKRQKSSSDTATTALPPVLADPKPSVTRQASGRKQSITEKRVSLKPQASLVSNEECALTFEQRLAKWILERLVEEEVDGAEELEPTDDPTEVLATFVADWTGEVPKVKQLLGQKCREFINFFCITHYVSSIELGASKYRVMSEEEYQTQMGVKGNLGIEQMASVAVEQKASFGRRNKSTEMTKIGHFEGGRVRMGTTDEAVVGVKFQPISALVKMRLLKNKLQNAIKTYIDNQEHSKAGPFIISCKDETLFLRVISDFKVVATTRIEDSSNFFISSNEDGDSPYEFSIMYMAASPLEGRGIKPISRYLYAPVNAFGNNDGPLGLRLDAKDTKTKMNLHSRRVRHFNPVDTKDWVGSRDIFYVNCKQRSVKKNGYICVKRAPRGASIEDEYITCCVPTIKKHNETKDHYMLFRLLRAGKKNPPKPKKEQLDLEEDEPLGVRKLGTSFDEQLSSLAYADEEQQLVGEDTVDSTAKKKKEGKRGQGRQGKGKGPGKKRGLSEIAEKNGEMKGVEGEEGGGNDDKEDEVEQEA